MPTLRQYVQDYINDLQPLLNASQDDQAFLKAVEKKWPNEDDLRCSFVVACQDELQLCLGDHGGENDNSTDINVLTGKQMF